MPEDRPANVAMNWVAEEQEADHSRAGIRDSQKTYKEWSGAWRLAGSHQ